MINLRRVLIIFISSLIIVIFTSCSKSEFIVHNSNVEIKNGIESFILKERAKRVEINLKSIQNIDNLKIISFYTLDQNYGYAILERKNTNTYKINSTAFYTDIIDQPIIQTKCGTYLLDISSNCNINIKLIPEKTRCSIIHLPWSLFQLLI